MKITSTRRLFLAGTGVVGSAAALAACGGQASEEEQQSKAAEDNEKAAEEQGELPSTGWERMDYDDVPDGGTLRKAILTFPANWNRSQVDGNNADTTDIAEPCGAGRGNQWFALADDRPAFFAGIETRGWRSLRKVRDGETVDDLFAFLTTAPNAEVAAVHPKAMPVILTTPADWQTWMGADWAEARRLQRPLPDGALRLIDPPG